MKLHGTAARRPFTRRPGNVGPPAVLRRRVETPAPVAADPLARDEELARVEAVLLMADEPLTARRIAEVCRLPDAGAARKRIQLLVERYDADGTAFQVAELAGGYQVLTRAEYHPWLQRLRRTGHDLRLTPAALETLTVIAYKQPVMRADVESVRGVACGEVIRLLMERGLVRAAGRHDSLGRPQQYGTTKKFLQAFGLNRIEDLPAQ